MVHCCLQTPEIVVHLCETVYFTRDGGFDHHRTLATMAKVCTMFRFWAEKLIWTDMHSLLPIIMSLSKDLWSVEGEEFGDPVLVFTRQLTTQEIEEFLAKSQRVSRLVLPKRTLPWKGEAAHQAEFLRVAPGTYEMLHLAALAAERVLFPNLVSLIVLDPCAELEAIYDQFGPNLEEVEIDRNLHLRGNNICRTFLDHLQRHNQGIRFLKIELAPPDVLEDIICGLPQLERLETRSFLTTKSLQHLGDLDTLESLTFKLDPFHPPSEWIGPFTFESIRSLACHCENLDDAILLLSKVSHRQLIHLEIEITCHDTYIPWSDGANDQDNGFLSSAFSQHQQSRHRKWVDLMAMASHNVSHSSLISLRIKECQSNPWYHDASPLNFDSIFEHLLAFKNLCQLEISAAGGISNVDERARSVIAHCLPLLKRINIKPPIVPSPTDLDSHYHCW